MDLFGSNHAVHQPAEIQGEGLLADLFNLNLDVVEVPYPGRILGAKYVEYKPGQGEGENVYPHLRYRQEIYVVDEDDNMVQCPKCYSVVQYEEHCADCGKKMNGEVRRSYYLRQESRMPDMPILTKNEYENYLLKKRNLKRALKRTKS